MKRYIILLLILITAVVAVQAQNDRDLIRKGNRLYRDSTFNKAEVFYRKALEKNPRNPQAMYNLGNALLMQQKPKDAMQQYENASKLETSKLRRSKAMHNAGVIFQSQKQYADAIKCYMRSLLDNPQDDETRYNLALCKKLLKNQPKNNGKNNDKNKNKKQNNKDNKKQNNKNNQDKDKDKQKQNQDKDKMSKDNAEQLLNAAVQQEKQTQQKLKKAMQQSRHRNLQQNW
jgi:tetratricopeptide (TPR) repeat protein